MTTTKKNMQMQEVPNFSHKLCVFLLNSKYKAKTLDYKLYFSVLFLKLQS